jgi:putative glutamine amidotransferase
MKPIIGINGDVKTDPEPSIRVKLNYVDAIRRAGGVPIVLPAGSPSDADAMLDRVDAMVLTGGGDIDVRARGAALHPSVELMDSRRQQFDSALARALLERDVPALGICLGMQMLAYESGAPLMQHLPDAGIVGLLDHRATHEISVMPGTRLAAILGVARAKVVSHHHQGVAKVPAPFRESAAAPDGVIEAFEAPDRDFFIGVQWHPERDPESPETHKLFAALVKAAGSRRR